MTSTYFLFPKVRFQVRIDEHCLVGMVNSLSSHCLVCILCKSKKKDFCHQTCQLASLQKDHTNQKIPPTWHAYQSNGSSALTEVKRWKEKMPLYPTCLSCLLQLRCWVTKSAIAAMNGCMLFHMARSKGCLQNCSECFYNTVFPGKQPGKRSICNEHQTSWGQSGYSSNTVSPVPWRLATPSYWGCNCELNSTIPLAWGFTVLEINLGIFASFSLASQSKRPLRGSREYFPWKTPGTGNRWSECLQTPRKALAQEHRHASIYSELWVIMLRFC